MTRILFVCLGNICRSPTLEAVARVEFARAGLAVAVDSAGTADYHAGQPPDRRSIAAGAVHGYDLSALRARQIVAADFTRFDRILAADRANLRDLAALRGGRGTQPALFLPDAEVPDPYYGGPADFERVIELARTGMAALIAELRGGPR